MANNYRGSTSSSTNGLLPDVEDNDNKECHNSDGRPEHHHLEVFDDMEDSYDDPFDIADTKNAPREILKRWRVMCVCVYISYVHC